MSLLKRVYCVVRRILAFCVRHIVPREQSCNAYGRVPGRGLRHSIAVIHHAKEKACNLERAKETLVICPDSRLREAQLTRFIYLGRRQRDTQVLRNVEIGRRRLQVLINWSERSCLSSNVAQGMNFITSSLTTWTWMGQQTQW